MMVFSIFKLENGNILFKVHIADPLAIFPYKSDVIKDAKNRTTTIINKMNQFKCYRVFWVVINYL